MVEDKATAILRENPIEFSPDSPEAKRVLKKIDHRILPLVTAIYTLMLMVLTAVGPQLETKPLNQPHRIKTPCRLPESWESGRMQISPPPNSPGLDHLSSVISRSSCIDRN